MVIALEAAPPAAVHDLADGGPRVEQPPFRVDLGRRALLTGLGAHDGQVHAANRLADRALGHTEHRVHGGAALALAVALDQEAAKPLAEAVAVAHRRLGAECALQRVVSVVGSLGGGQDVGDRLADVAELRGPESAHVVEEGGRAEARPHRDGRADHHRRAPKRHERVAVEERHGAVADVVGGVAVARCRHLGDAGQPTLGALDRLGHAGRTRGEDQEVQRLLAHLVDVGDERLGLRSACKSRQQRLVARCPDDQDALGVDAEREALEQCRALGIGHDHGAVGGADVRGQRLARGGWG